MGDERRASLASTGPEEDFVPPIMRLPREIRGIIFNKLPQLEIVCLRFVCKSWRQDVDDFCEFSVTLDDRQPKSILERKRNLRIKKLRVLHFLEDISTENGDEAVKSGFLKYPSLLRSLKIVTESITPEVFLDLLKDASPYLKEFCGVLNRRILQFNGYPDNFPLRFDNLTRLRLSVSTMPGEGADVEEPILGPPTFNDKLFYKIFGGNLMKCLKMLAIEIRCLGYLQCSRLSSQVLQFIANHHGNLEHVDFDLIQGHGVPASFNEIRPLRSQDLDLINLKYLKKCSKLLSIRLVNSTAIGVDLLQDLLLFQKNLQFLETDILPAPNTLYRQVILNNEATLVHIDIGDLTIDLDGELEENWRFDCQIFQNCKQLRKLTLDRDTTRRRPFGGDLLSAELINLHCLPELLEELNLNYFLLLSDELLILFSGEGPRENLKTLALTQCGDSGDFGVDGSVLEKVISMKSIDFIEVSPLNFTYPEEARKLNQILITFGYNEGHGYFQLSRISQNFQINFDDFSP